MRLRMFGYEKHGLICAVRLAHSQSFRVRYVIEFVKT
jgi:hypothetical protein